MKSKKNVSGIKAMAVFWVIMLAFAGLSVRIYFIGQNDSYVNAANEQSAYKVTVAQTVGTVYDRNFIPLTNCNETVAAVTAIPTELGGYVDALKEISRDYSAIEGLILGGKPFAFTAVKEYTGNGIMTFPIKTGNQKSAVHILGYITSHGGTGLINSYRDILEKYSGEISVTYKVNAVGKSLEGDSVTVTNTTEKSLGGIVTTLDLGVQKAAQEALSGVTGAAVVMDTNGNIAAICSSPTYDTDDLSQAVADERSPMLNRALQSYNVGSVFKICVSAAAIEAGMEDFIYDCGGSINVYGREIGCHKHDGHGLMNIQTALVNSCNPYFIALGQRLGSEKIVKIAEKMSFGQEITLATGISSKSGILPSIAELAPPAALANLSIGQGTLLASPLQVAVAVNSIATGGIRVTPGLIKGETTDGKYLINKEKEHDEVRILSVETANEIKCNMERVFTDGSLKKYAPQKYTAAGKTSTAQTGIVGSDGETICQTWVAGFYPSNNPQYTVVVLVEDGSSGTASAAPIFKKIVDYIGKNCIV